MIKYFPIYIFVVIAIVMSACYNEPDCEHVVAYDYVNIGFYDIETKLEKKRKFISIRAIGSDSIFYPDEIKDSLQVFTLHVNPMKDTVVFIFRTAVSRDTLTLTYQRQLDWVSQECGPLLKYSELDTVSYTFDSVVLIQKLFDVRVNEHIEIYN